jgi:putative monooxygenase ydhR
MWSVCAMRGRRGDRHARFASTTTNPGSSTMHIRIVTFTIGVPADEYGAHAAAVAEAFTEWPGLLGKIWLADRERNRYGGVYVFASKADADRSRSTSLFAGMAANPAMADLVIEEYETLSEACAVTWPAMTVPPPRDFAPFGISSHPAGGVRRDRRGAKSGT